MLLCCSRSYTANWTRDLPCGGWDCDCVFRNSKGCCCVAVPLFQLEETTFMRMVDLWKDLNSLSNKIQEITGNTHFFSSTVHSSIILSKKYQ